MEENILRKIEEELPSLSLKQKKVALAILQDPLSASFLSVKEMSKKIGVSPATIVRFAQDITGAGFPQLQIELHKHIQAESNPVKRMKLHVVVNSKDEELLAKAYETQLSNLQKTFTQEMFRSMSRAYDLIMSANHVYSLGSRGSFCVSYFLAQHLNRALGKVDLVPDDDKLADFLKRVKEDDVAIFVCVPRYSKRLLTTAEILKKKKLKIISINDSSQSPFLPYSDTAFFAPSISNDFHNSIISAMMIAELLITLTIAKNSESTISHLNEYEQYFDALEQFCIPG